MTAPLPFRRVLRPCLGLAAALATILPMAAAREDTPAQETPAQAAAAPADPAPVTPASTAPAPTDPAAAARIMDLALKGFSLGDELDETIASLEESVRADPTFVPALKTLARLREARNEWDEALRWQAALAASPDRAIADEARTEVSRLQNLRAEYQTEEGKARILNRQTLAEARVLADFGEYEHVVIRVQSVISLQPEIFESYPLLADALVHQGDLTGGLAALKEARRLAPPDRVEEVDRAIGALEQDRDYDALLTSAREKISHGKNAEAAADLQRSYALRPENEEVGLEAARALGLSNQVDEATRILETLARSSNAETSTEAAKLTEELPKLAEMNRRVREASEALEKERPPRPEGEADRGAASPAQMRETAKMLLEGDLVDQDTDAALLLLRKAGEAGDAEAQHRLGELYNTGQGVQRNEKAALHWYKHAAEQAYVPSMVPLAGLYDPKYGVEHSYQDCLRWYAAAANAGVKKIYTTAAWVAEGQNDLATAAKWYEAGASQGDLDCFERISSCYNTGRGVPRDKGKALYYLNKGMELGSETCAFFLAYTYGNADGVPQDKERAFSIWFASANRGYVQSMIRVADCYLKGYGVSRDDYQAFVWLQKVVVDNKSEDPWALGWLAHSYYYGKGVQRDILKGVELAQKGSQRSGWMAMYVLGRAHLDGYGVNRDPAAAVRLLKAGSDGGDAYCMTGYADLLMAGRHVPADPYTAAKLYEKASYYGNAEAGRKIGLCFLTGNGVEQNRIRAKSFLQGAVEKGDEEAQNLLDQYFQR